MKCNEKSHNPLGQSGRWAAGVVLGVLLSLVSCDPFAFKQLPGGLPATGVPALAEHAACGQAGSDLDQDGLPEACELAMAAGFAPQLVLDPASCDHDPAESLPRGGWLWAVQPVSPGYARIVYLPAYEVDCGWDAPKCWLPFIDCSGHAGDSEAIALGVRREAAGWRAERVFLSAHCFDSADCRWYLGSDLERFEWQRASPVVWVARGKHANYPTRQACDRGHTTVDSCDDNVVRIQFPVYADRNLGSERFPLLDCMVHPDRGGRVEECFWTERAFTGWQERRWGDPPTAYSHYLRLLLR